MSEPASNVSPIARPPRELVPSKRLSIADLLLIMVGSAIAILILQPPSATQNVPIVIVNAVMSPLYGSAVTAVFLAVWRSLTGREPFASEPGHTLLLIIGTMFTGIGVAARMFPPDIVVSDRQPFPILLVVIALMGAFLAILSLVLILAAIYGNEHQPLRWKLVFRLIGWTLALGVVGSLFLPAGGFSIFLLPVLIFTPPVLLLVATISAVVIDLWARTYRDHWHWLGVSTFLGLPMHILLLIIAEQFAQ